MGFKGASLHVRDKPQDEVASSLVTFMDARHFELDVDSRLCDATDNMLSEFDPNETRDWQTPFCKRTFRSFVVLPQHKNWTSIHERGEFHDLDLGRFVSFNLQAVVAATCWESIISVQMIRIFREGELTDYLLDYDQTIPGDFIMDEAEYEAFCREGALTRGIFAGVSAFDFILDDYVTEDLGIDTAMVNFKSMLEYQEGPFRQESPIGAARLLRFRNQAI